MKQRRHHESQLRIYLRFYRNMKTALLHYWLTNMRGGEKVLAALGEMWPEADIFTHAFGMGMREKVRGTREKGEGTRDEGEGTRDEV